MNTLVPTIKITRVTSTPLVIDYLAEERQSYEINYYRHRLSIHFGFNTPTGHFHFLIACQIILFSHDAVVHYFICDHES